MLRLETAKFVWSGLTWHSFTACHQCPNEYHQIMHIIKSWISLKPASRAVVSCTGLTNRWGGLLFHANVEAAGFNENKRARIGQNTFCTEGYPVYNTQGCLLTMSCGSLIVGCHWSVTVHNYQNSIELWLQSVSITANIHRKYPSHILFFIVAFCGHSSSLQQCMVHTPLGLSTGLTGNQYQTQFRILFH